MTTALLPFPGNEAMAEALSRHTGWPVIGCDAHRFPDGETLLRVHATALPDTTAVVATLDRPDAKLAPLCFLAGTARDLGARRVGLIAPYLCYLRQDAVFHPGESMTARHCARLLASAFDWLVTVEPHLHRYKALRELFGIPAEAVHVPAALAAWIRGRVTAPLIIGPDEESAQWARAVAEPLAAPCLVLRKIRHGDRDVDIELPDTVAWRDRTPVLVDDMIATGGTLAKAAALLQARGFAPPAAVGVHAVFAGDAEARLRRAGIGELVTANTIPHPTNGIDVTPDIAAAARRM